MKISLGAVGATVILFAALSVMSVLAGREGYGNLLLAAPSGFGAAGISPERLDEFSEEECLLTYEIKQTAMAEAIRSKHTVILAGTNQHYADVMRYVLLDGGFFTQSAWDAQNKHVVLNETAAFRIFGSSRITGQTLKINGEAWIVTGVMDDNDAENANVYAPSSVTGGQATSLMVLLDGKAVTEAYAKNALKSIGVHESNYNFINLDKAAASFDERFSVAWKAAVLAVLLILALKAGGGLLQSLRFYRSRLREIYFRELFQQNRADLIKTIAGLLFLVTGAVAALLLSLDILATCLTWQELAPVTGELVAGAFGGKLAWLREHQWIDTALFTAYIGIVLFQFLSELIKRSGKGQVRTYVADDPDR